MVKTGINQTDVKGEFRKLEEVFLWHFFVIIPNKPSEKKGQAQVTQQYKNEY